jgi:uncharacterized membrane protein YqjE
MNETWVLIPVAVFIVWLLSSEKKCSCHNKKNDLAINEIIGLDEYEKNRKTKSLTEKLLDALIMSVITVLVIGLCLVSLVYVFHSFMLFMDSSFSVHWVRISLSILIIIAWISFFTWLTNSKNEEYTSDETLNVALEKRKALQQDILTRVQDKSLTVDDAMSRLNNLYTIEAKRLINELFETDEDE